jgi:ribose transport system ATP-binding protein
LPAPKKQLTEIAKALSQSPQLLILDEPTAALSDVESKWLFGMLKNLRQQGMAIIYISHRLQEVLDLADRVTVLKDGRYQATFLRNETTAALLIQTMVGRELPAISGARPDHGKTVLELKEAASARVGPVNLRLRAGEVVGLAGLMGSGRSELARLLFGADACSGGEILIDQMPVQFKHPHDAIRHGIALVPEDRQAEGLFKQMSTQHNIEVVQQRQQPGSKSGFINRQLLDRLHIARQKLHQPVATLSGGNQQKVMLARWLSTGPRVLILDEPTHGIDIGAKFEIYQLIKQEASNGTAMLVISSELPELLMLCHRILVMRQGTISGERAASETTEEELLAMAM